VPRLLALSGYAIAAALLILAATITWSVLLFPAWVALVSLHILRRGHVYAPHAAATRAGLVNDERPTKPSSAPNA
jgi:hypothetical protein